MGNNSENIKQMVEQLYTDRDQTGDAVFIVESQQIRAHRNVLAALSPKYKAQFYGPNPDVGEIRVPNVSAAAFKTFIQFFYKESIELTMENIGSVLDLAQQSLVDGFVEICINFLKTSITISNVCFVYRLAILYDIESLCLDCEQQIISKTMDVFASDDFLQCDRNVLLHILNLDTFNCSEADVFYACIEWARTDCKQKTLDEKNPKNLRESLGDAIYLVRFASMNAEEFAILHKSMDGFFKVDELAELLYITNKLKDFTPKMYNNTPRALCSHPKDSDYLKMFNGSPAWSHICNLLEFERTLKDHRKIFNGEHVVFACNHPIRLHGFALGIYLDRSIDDISCSATVQLEGGSTGTIKFKCKVYRNPQRKNDTLFIFENPIEKIKFFNWKIELPEVRLNYELVLKKIAKVKDIEFNVHGEWATRFFFDKL